MTLAALSTPTDDLLEAYVTHCALMAPSPGQLRATFGRPRPSMSTIRTSPSG